MNVAGQTLCLNMIVKNEATVIRRCLDSVRPLINHWVIVDTGSTDGTQDIIREYLRDLPGELHEQPWQDFAYNRSQALKLARGKCDYILIIDADDTLEIAPNVALPALTTDSYTIEIRDAPTLYRRIQLVRSSLPWRYEGVLHEYLTCDEANSSDHLSTIWMHRNHDGARRKDPETYRRDAAVLETALKTETRPFLLARYRFYLAQSYYDCGEHERALEHDLARAELGFWQEEVFISLYRAAQTKERLRHPEQDVIDAYLRATDALPTRVEALHGASRFCRHKGRNEEGYQIAKRGLDIVLPSDALFVEPWIYETGLLDEFSVNAYWSGHYRDCIDASLKILSTEKYSGKDLERVVANVRFASERLPRDPNLGSLGVEGFLAQHPLAPPKPLRSRIVGSPRVLVAILAKQKEASLPLYLECIEALDYPKSSIVLYIRTNNNTDRTEEILRDWLARVGHLYADVEIDAEDVAERVEEFGVHEWNPTRFRVLAKIRNVSLGKTHKYNCQFYFVSDLDNFVRPCTLRELVSLNLPIVAPLLRSVGPEQLYSNYHAEVDANGYYLDCDQYHWSINRSVRGILDVPLVHCTYLVRRDVLQNLSYEDGTGRYEYVIFSDNARKSHIPQYLDNRQVYGYISFSEDGQFHVKGGVDSARSLLQSDFAAHASNVQASRELLETLDLLTPYAVSDYGKIRVGHDSDGGYVMLDDIRDNAVCYSLGIAEEISWDLELANRGAKVFQFDDSVDGPPVSHPNFIFTRVRIDGNNAENRDTTTLNALITSNSDLQNRYVLLKMDIEGSEWNVIDATHSGILGVFSQIIIEFHGMTRLSDPLHNEVARRVFSKLNRTHFPVHLHGNNWGASFEIGYHECPDVIEVTFANRALYQASRDFTTYPTQLDRPCRGDRPDFDLGRFPFRLVNQAVE